MNIAFVIALCFKNGNCYTYALCLFTYYILCINSFLTTLLLILEIAFLLKKFGLEPSNMLNLKGSWRPSGQIPN